MLWTDLPRNRQIPNFMKIRPVGTELFHGQSVRHTGDIKKLTFFFFFFANLGTRLK